MYILCLVRTNFMTTLHMRQTRNSARRRWLAFGVKFNKNIPVVIDTTDLDLCLGICSSFHFVLYKPYKPLGLVGL